MVNINDFLERPYDDIYMKYNYEENRYVLTIDGANSSNMDIIYVMGDAETTNEYLDLLSRSLYTVFLSNKDSKYHNKQLWVLSHSKTFRQAIYKIFLDAVWYNFRSGGFMTAYQTGINLNEMKQLDIKLDLVISIIGKTMAKNMGILERVPRYKITKSTYYDTIDDFKDGLVLLNIYTEEELENVTSIDEINSKNQYYLYYSIIKSKYVIEDNSYYEKQMALKGVEW